jgi:hypothetical protein
VPPHEWPQVLDEVCRAHALVPMTQLLNWGPTKPAGGRFTSPTPPGAPRSASPHSAQGPRLRPFPENAKSLELATPLQYGDVTRAGGVRTFWCATPSCCLAATWYTFQEL